MGLAEYELYCNYYKLSLVTLAGQRNESSLEKKYGEIILFSQYKIVDYPLFSLFYVLRKPWAVPSPEEGKGCSLPRGH